MHESELDLLPPAEAAFQRAVASAKYLARKLSATNTLEHASGRRVAELADLLDAARALYDVTESEAEAHHEPRHEGDPALDDTQVAEVDESLARLRESLDRQRR